MTTQLSSSTASGRMMANEIVTGRRIAMGAFVLGCAGALQLLEGYLTEEHYVMMAFCGMAYYALEKQGMVLSGAGRKKKVVVPRFSGQDNYATEDDQTEKKQRPKKKLSEKNDASSSSENEADAAEGVVDAKKKTEAEARVMNCRIRDLVKAGELEEAVKVFGLMGKKVSPDLVSYNSLIHGFATIGQLQTAENWLKKAEAAGHVLDVYSFAPLIKGHLRWNKEGVLGDPAAGGEAWLRKMREGRGVIGDVTLYNLVLEAKAKSNAPPAKVDSWLFMMLEDGPAPDTASFNAAMRAWSKSTADADRSVQRVESWFKRMQVRKLAADFHSYQNLILAYGKAGKAEKAAETFGRMVEDGVPPHPSCYAAMLQVYADTKKFEETWALHAEMKRRGVSMSLHDYQVLLRPIAAAGDLAQVEKVLDAMRKDGFAPEAEAPIVGLWVSAYAGRNGSPSADVRTPQRIVEEAIKAGAKVDQFVLNGLERAVGPAITEGMVKKMKLEGKGWKPKEWRAVSFSHGTNKKFTSSCSEHKIIRPSYSLIPTTCS